MFYPPKLYLKDRYISLPGLASLLLTLFMAWYAVTRIHPTSDSIFLHYNVFFRIDLVGEWWKLWLIPAFGGGVLILNFLVSYFIYSNNKFLSRLLIALTAFVEITILIGLVLIVGLNI